MKFRRILDVLYLQVLQKRFLAQFHDLCVQKWSGLLWSSDAFWKFSPFKLYKKSSGHFFPIYVSKNEVVCHGVQTHFGSSLLASFTEKVLGAIPRFVRPKKKAVWVWNSDAFWTFSTCKVYRKKFRAECQDICVQKRSGLLWSSDAFLTFSPCMLYIKCSGHIFTIYASKNEAVCCEIQTHFGSSPLASFTEKVLGTISLFVRPKMKWFAVKFRRILEVLCLRVFHKKFWAQFHNLCVQKQSWLPWNSDAFWKFSACKVFRKNLGAILRFVCPKTKQFAVKYRRVLEVCTFQAS